MGFCRVACGLLGNELRVDSVRLAANPSRDEAVQLCRELTDLDYKYTGVRSAPPSKFSARASVPSRRVGLFCHVPTYKYTKQVEWSDPSISCPAFGRPTSGPVPARGRPGSSSGPPAPQAQRQPPQSQPAQKESNVSGR